MAKRRFHYLVLYHPRVFNDSFQSWGCDHDRQCSISFCFSSQVNLVNEFSSVHFYVIVEVFFNVYQTFNLLYFYFRKKRQWLKVLKIARNVLVLSLLLGLTWLFGFLPAALSGYALDNNIFCSNYYRSLRFLNGIIVYVNTSFNTRYVQFRLELIGDRWV